MKSIAINGSRRKQGNTSTLLEATLSAAKQAGAETEIISLGDYRIEACTGCEGCSRSWQCIIKDDFSAIIEKLDEADGVILGSPTYWYSVTSDMKRFIDRSYSLIQFPVNRHQWIGKYQETAKACVTAAVCEQSDEALMGNTLTLLTDFSRDIGLEVVDSVKALGFFSAGSINTDRAVLQQAKLSGQKLLQHLTAQDSTR